MHVTKCIAGLFFANYHLHVVDNPHFEVAVKPSGLLLSLVIFNFILTPEGLLVCMFTANNHDTKNPLG